MDEREQRLHERPEHAWLFTPSDGWYNASQVARGLGLTRPTVAAMCKRGEIPGAIWYGDDIGWRMPRAGLIEFLVQRLDSQQQAG